MKMLSALEPKKVFYFFEQICSIPHGSGNMEQISNFLVEFAKERNLFYIQDQVKNVIIIKEASQGYEDQPPIILQGHMDMVAVKKPDCNIDINVEGLRLAVDGDYIYAQGTSLGGDDGIAVAYALALLDDEQLNHPRLEVVITVDEEVGMDGARVIDLSMLKANRMLNLDSEEEGIFLTSCAGGARIDCRIPVQRKRKSGIAYKISIDGLSGGHSGADIHKEKGNAINLMGRMLYTISDQVEIGIDKLSAGLADNAIPRQAEAVLVVGESGSRIFEEIVSDVGIQISEELAGKDPNVRISVERLDEGIYYCITGDEAYRCSAFLVSLPNGVQVMSADMPGMVETSLNLGILHLDQEELCVCISVRSSVESAKHALMNKVKALTALAGGDITVKGEYPGWKYRVSSPLRDKMIELYYRMYGTKPKIEGIHAGLECGILGSKIEGLDCVSIGPDMKNIHTTEEMLSISSTARVWEYLVNLLKERDI